MSSIGANLIAQLKADKKKFSALATLVVVGLLLWSRLLLQTVPKTADAQPLGDVVTATVAAADNTATPASNNPLLATTLRSVGVNLHATVDRNIFLITGPAVPQPTPTTENVLNQAKSVPDPTDSKRDREAVIAEAHTLSLQSTLLGERPRAMINGQLLAPGQKIQGFEVLEVQPRQVTVRKNQVLISLKMFEP